mgnify:CR=1 FL=1
MILIDISEYLLNSILFLIIVHYIIFLINKYKGDEKVIEFLDEALPLFLAPVVIVLLIRIFYQIITY